MKTKNHQFGKVSNQSTNAHPDYPEIEKLTDTFKIKVKVDELDDDGNVTGEKVLYSKGYDNTPGEPFEYYKVPSLSSALKYLGAKLTEDQESFLKEALAGSKETGEATSALIQIFNEDLKNSAQRSQYSKVLNANTPMTDENRDNAMASTVRNFVKTAGVSPEVAIGMLKGLNPSPLSADYTVARFLANKGKR